MKTRALTRATALCDIIPDRATALSVMLKVANPNQEELMPRTPAIDVSVRPMPREIAHRYGRLPEYRHIFEHIFKRPEVINDGIPLEEMAAEMDRHNIERILVSG